MQGSGDARNIHVPRSLRIWVTTRSPDKPAGGNTGTAPPSHGKGHVSAAAAPADTGNPDEQRTAGIGITAPGPSQPAPSPQPALSSAGSSPTLHLAPSMLDLQSAGDESSLGLAELVSQPADKQDAVDIVAIHGLNGHREKTWIDKTTRVNWLSDPSCLPKDIPHAPGSELRLQLEVVFQQRRLRRLRLRVRASFRPQGGAEEPSRKAQTHHLCARSLVECSTFFHTLPPTWSPHTCDLQHFVCHSLGGIVFKQAVVRAHEQDRYYAQLLESIHGVVFFATPHRGSDLAFWGSIAARVAQAASFGFSANSKLSKDLKVDSVLLKHISDSFVYRGGNLNIRSFYETEFMPKLNCRIVEKDSATLGWSNELDIASSSNHSTICKFPSPTDKRYQTAIFAIHDMMDSVDEANNNIRES
ncbi:hypothetical protein EDB81DRAFT_954385 [Dactylonectria macrodidyma]|uniref:DUF676 domain-containing protein n=1 Tax=Dactylonectria macrodidyma TaxID=307937 RepID=A0A9P9I5Z7_9HYPO|nr:hypothetical protein EDB81DRAFT_954385 [Dactylonectria macrodidyma]